jgi:maleylacetate reductase
VTSFVYDPHPVRVVFGPGRRREVAAEAARIGMTNALVVCGSSGASVAEAIAARLGSSQVLTAAAMHVPAELADDALARLRAAGSDGLIAVGGGSPLGLCKAMARRTGLPILAVPTTYAGSEMTSIWGETADGVKTTGRDQAVLPRTIVYDPELTLTLPVAASVTSAFNALAHAAEGLYAPDASPVTTLLAQEAARLCVTELPLVVADPAGIEARSLLLRGAWLAGTVLGGTTMSLHHKLCHVLGGALGLPHAQTHTVVLPYVLAFNAPAALDLLRTAVNDPDPVTAIWRLGRETGAPGSLAELGMTAADIPLIVEQVLAAPYHNPRPVTAEDIQRLLTSALAGDPPVLSGGWRAVVPRDADQPPVLGGVLGYFVGGVRPPLGYPDQARVENGEPVV